MGVQDIDKKIYNIIASGSKGNCEILHECIMLDCGVSFLKIKPYIQSIKIVFIFHQHSDHMNLKTIKKISKERPSVRFAIGEWLVPFFEGIRNVDVLELNKWYDYGQFKVSLGKLYHDVPNAFIRVDHNGFKTFRATDTYTLEGITAKDYDLYAIEHNYNEDTIRGLIEKSEQEGKYTHLRGSINSHLSEQQARDFIYNNRKESSKVLRLHESTTAL